MAQLTHSDIVRQYYEDNTKKFVELGQGNEGTIRRAVWGPGVSTRAESMVYVDQLILDRLQRHQTENEQMRVLDLGCGVGGSLCHLAAQLPISGQGFTLSETQVQLASQRAETLGLQSAITFRSGDFCELPADVGVHDLAFAIESFVHAADPGSFFLGAARALRPGGLLIVCDDFVTDDAVLASPAAQPWLERVRKGWLMNSMVGPQQIDAMSQAAGFVALERIDLTGQLELGRPRDLAIAALMRTLGWLPIRNSYWGMLRGGHALQLALTRGWLRYDFKVWRRT